MAGRRTCFEISAANMAKRCFPTNNKEAALINSQEVEWPSPTLRSFNKSRDYSDVASLRLALIRPSESLISVSITTIILQCWTP